MQHNNYVKEYSILRVLLTLLVVIGHCTYYSIITDFGGIDWKNEMLNAGVSDTSFHRIASALSAVIYTFHIPMFFALSGALFEHGKTSSFWLVFSTKARRLLLPFVLITTFYSVPIKYLTGYWKNSTSIIKDILFGQYFIQGNTHLWFLPILFLEFVFFKLISESEKKSMLSHYTTVFFVLLMIFSSSFIPIKIISQFMAYAIWFYIGILFERNRSRYDRFFTPYNLILTFFIWVILVLIKFILFNGTVSSILWGTLLTSLTTVAAMMFSYSSCKILSNTIIMNSKALKLIEKYSFGIYLFSDPINYIILLSFANIFSITMFGNEIASFCLYISRLVISLCLSLIICRFVSNLNNLS